MLKKLKSKSGATVIIALCFFLICLIIGGAILTAATANSGRLSHLKRDQQAYLTVSSAARLVSDELSGRGAVISRSSTTQYYDGAAGTASVSDAAVTFSGGGTSLSEYLRADLLGHFATMCSAAAPLTQTGCTAVSQRALTFEAESFAGVSGEWTIDESFNITLALNLTDTSGDGYSITLLIPAVVTEDSLFTASTPPELYDTGEVDEDGEPIMGSHYSSTTTRTVSVAWGETVMSGGDAE